LETGALPVELHSYAARRENRRIESGETAAFFYRILPASASTKMRSQPD
jgi:hypothetical protein